MSVLPCMMSKVCIFLFQKMWFMVLYCAAEIAKWATELRQEEESLGAVQGWGPDLVNYFTLKEWPRKKWNLCPACDLATLLTPRAELLTLPMIVQWDFPLSAPVFNMHVVFLAGSWGLGKTQDSSWVWRVHPLGGGGQASRRDEIAEQNTLIFLPSSYQIWDLVSGIWCGDRERSHIAF